MIHKKPKHPPSTKTPFPRMSECPIPPGSKASSSGKCSKYLTKKWAKCDGGSKGKPSNATPRSKYDIIVPGLFSFKNSPLYGIICWGWHLGGVLALNSSKILPLVQLGLVIWKDNWVPIKVEKSFRTKVVMGKSMWKANKNQSGKDGLVLIDTSNAAQWNTSQKVQVL